MAQTKHVNTLSRLYFKKHIPYLLLLSVITACIIAVLMTVNARVSEIQNKLNTTRLELDELRTKKDLIQNFALERETIDQDLLLMSRLIPQSQDYFSIIQSLENLSQRTQFQIVSYQINLTESTDSKLSIVVRGIGDSQSFLTFLDSYQVDGGRLITMEKLKINPQTPGEVQLDMNFYIESPAAADRAIEYEETIRKLDQIKGTISYDLAAPTATGEQDYSFETKKNPF